MTLTAHALVGGAIAVSISNPVVGITLATFSHVLLDMIPHWDEGRGWRQKSKVRLFSESLFDLSLGFGLAYFFFGQFVDNFWYFFMCVFASQALDFLQGPYLILNWKVAPFTWCYKIQSKMQGRAGLPWGIVSQFATVLLIVWLLRIVP